MLRVVLQPLFVLRVEKVIEGNESLANNPHAVISKT
jgi:hypothetical protein